MILQSTTDFVLEQFQLLYNAKISQDQYVTRTKKFADLLKQPPQLWMFVPCDDEGNVLEEMIDVKVNDDKYMYDLHIYQKAKERVLFEGFETDNGSSVYSYLKLDRKYSVNQMFDTIHEDFAGFYFYDVCNSRKRLNTIEDLIKFQKLTLTPSAIKQLGL